MTQPLHAVTHMFDAESQTWPPAHVVAPGTQLSVVSLHVSVPLHVTASAQKFVAEPAHRPPEHTSPRVQKSPSSQLAPSFGLKLEIERAMSHTWHWFVGLLVPAA